MIRILELILDNNLSVATILQCEYIDIEIPMASPKSAKLASSDSHFVKSKASCGQTVRKSVTRFMFPRVVLIVFLIKIGTFLQQK